MDVVDRMDTVDIVDGVRGGEDGAMGRTSGSSRLRKAYGAAGSSLPRGLYFLLRSGARDLMSRGVPRWRF